MQLALVTPIHGNAYFGLAPERLDMVKSSLLPICGYMYKIVVYIRGGRRRATPLFKYNIKILSGIKPFFWRSFYPFKTRIGNDVGQLCKKTNRKTQINGGKDLFHLYRFIQIARYFNMYTEVKCKGITKIIYYKS